MQMRATSRVREHHVDRVLAGWQFDHSENDAVPVIHFLVDRGRIEWIDPTPSGRRFPFMVPDPAGHVVVAAKPDRVHNLALQWRGMMWYIWMINGQAFPNAAPLDVKKGESVRFNAANYTMVPHPMHIHGHFFKVLGSAGGTKAPLVKDTLLIPRGHMMFPGRLDADTGR